MRLLTCLMALSLAACGADDVALDAAPEAPEGFGTLLVEVGALDTYITAFKGTLTATATGSGGESAQFDLAFGTTRTVHHVFLKKGTYTIKLEALIHTANGPDAVLHSGQVTGFDIFSGTNSLTLNLTPEAGALDIRVDLGGDGHNFDDLPNGTVHFQPLPGNSVPSGLTMASRVLAGVRTYHAWTMTGTTSYHSASTDLLVWPAWNQAGIGNPSGIYYPPLVPTSTVAVAGGRFYAIRVTGAPPGTFQLIASDNGWRWRIESETLISTANAFNTTDVLEKCALIIDNQFNAYCIVKTDFVANNITFLRHVVVHAHSQDGFTWTPLIPYSSGTTIDAMFVGPTAAVPDIEAAYVNGVYHLWSSVGTPHTGKILHSSSLDRSVWSAMGPTQLFDHFEFAMVHDGEKWHYVREFGASSGSSSHETSPPPSL